tara:strand:- start:219 stop:2021 length:1803 start_codon:yes stop_codon:yes gene_type:complete
MLDLSPGNLYNEITSAEAMRDEYISSMDDLVEQFVGPAYSSKIDDQNYLPENHVYEYLSLTVPRLIYDNPRVHVKTRRPVSQGDASRAIEHGVNRWIRDTNCRHTLQRIAYDMLLGYGVCMTIEEPMQGYGIIDHGGPHWPVIHRLSPSRWFMDSQAMDISEARFCGHRWIRDKEDLLNEASVDPSWNKKVIEALSTDASVDETRNADSKSPPPRNEVVCYEIWVPEKIVDGSPGPELGFNGSIYTMAVSNPGDDSNKKSADFIRKPRPYYGPATGPYTLFGAYTVPDKPYPLSPIMANQPQCMELNEHVRSATRSAAQYKKLVFVDARNKKLVQDIKNQPDNFVVPVDGLSPDSVVPAEFGGITNQQLTYMQVCRDRLDRNSGIQDAQRGVVTGDATATEVQVAEAAGSLRFSFVHKQYQDCVQQVMKKVAWYLYHDERVSFPLGEKAAEEMGIPEPIFVGGLQREVTGATYADLELEIDTFSMQKSNEPLLQRRAMDSMNLIIQSAQIMADTPFIDWDTLLKKLGDAMNVPELGELIDREMLMQMVQQQQEQEEAMAQAKMMAGQARGNQQQSRQAPQQGPQNDPLADRIRDLAGKRK